jgi:hypothetical protein
MYNVGFGDCFLMSVPYDAAHGGERHVLLDFGSHPKPKGAPAGFMEAIARDIAARCQGGRLAVVATHRHADHISGFTTNAKGTASGDIIRAIKPEIVIQPWTEHPRAAQNAHSAPRRLAARQLHEALNAMQSFAAALVTELERLPRFLPRAFRQQLTYTGQDVIKNQAAVENLMTMGRRKARYVHAGGASGLDTFLPGVKIHVLGPPTLDQAPGIGAYAKSSPEYWLRRRLLALRAAPPGRRAPRERALFPRARQRLRGRFPAHATWFIARMRQAYADELLAIVTELDSFLNNTSIILLFEIAGQKLLFPGDAQLENWSYALAKHRKRLAGVTVYKVGHHGSLNATPRTLWRLMTEGDTAVSTAQFRTLMSTLPDVHGGKTGLPTEVPRGPLVEEFRRRSQLISTLDQEGFGTAQDVQL